jgi:hypothetical protein
VWKDQPSHKYYSDTETQFPLMNSKRTKKTIDLIVLPHHSAFLRFKVGAKREKARESTIEIKIKPVQFKSINISYSYVVHEGSLTFQPQVYKYQPAFQNMLQTKILTVRSNFSFPIEISSVKSSDPRIDARILNKEIKPWNMSISGMISFDAGKTGTESQSDFIKAISQFSIENPPTLQIDAFNLQKMSNKKNFKFGSQQLSGSDLFNKFQSLNDKEILQLIKSLEPHLKEEDGNIDRSSLINMNIKDGFANTSPKQNLINVPIKDLFKTSLAVDQNGEFTTFGPQKGLENKQSTGVFAPPDKDFKMNESLNYRDILAWRDRQDEWKSIERNFKQAINASLEIRTSLIEKIEIPIEAALKKPKIFANDSLEFGPVQVGSSRSKDIVIHNPTSETIQVQLFLAFDLDESFIAKKTSKQAWMDKVAFRDKMLRQIELFMKGVEPDYVAQVEHIFEELRSSKAAEDYDVRSEEQNFPGQNIVDILMTYYKLSEEDRKFEVE